MDNDRPKISVCIPAFNTTTYLSYLLDSIVKQDYEDYETVVVDDNSPLSDEIRKITEQFINKYPGKKIFYFKNRENLGYDGNLRSCLNHANGEYVLFMGDDDLMCPGALSKVGKALSGYDNIGVFLRSYVSIERDTEKVIQIFKYFSSDKFFTAGPETAITFYRRSVVISGMTVHRLESIKYETNRFDGTLLYQQYLVANILLNMNGIYLSDPVTKYRTGGIHNFGSSSKEKGIYKPKIITPQHSLHFMKGMFDIAEFVEKERGVKIYKRIVKDIGNYSYPILSIQAGNKKGFIWYSYNLAKMGLWKNMLFLFYFFVLLIFKPKIIDYIICKIKLIFGSTPLLGKIYSGEKI